MQQSKIKSITKLDTKTDRYDLTVPQNHNFFANGILIHNTSQRTAFLPGTVNLNRFQRLWNRLPLVPKYPQLQYQYVTGTRHSVLQKEDTGYYAGTNFRRQIHEQLVPFLARGETFYYEIVGFDDSGRRIMPAHGVEDKDLQTRYGEEMVYKYGCHVDGICSIFERTNPRYRVLVYRITQTNESGDVTELSWEQVKARCVSIGVEHVIELARTFFMGQEELITLCREHSSGSDPLDPSHIREGVCVRVEDQKYWNILKWKSSEFAHLEGIRSNDQFFIDPEDIA